MNGSFEHLECERIVVNKPCYLVFVANLIFVLYLVYECVVSRILRLLEKCFGVILLSVMFFFLLYVFEHLMISPSTAKEHDETPTEKVYYNKFGDEVYRKVDYDDEYDDDGDYGVFSFNFTNFK